MLKACYSGSVKSILLSEEWSSQGQVATCMFLIMWSNSPTYILLPFTFHALLLTTKQWVHHCPLYTTTHPASQVDVSNHGSLLWSEQDVSRIEHKVLHLQYCWFLWTEASAQTPFWLQELTKWMSNQTASSCLLLMLLLPEVAKSKGYESRAAPMALQSHWPAPLTWGLGQAQWLAAACSYISVSRIMPHWK